VGAPADSDVAATGPGQPDPLTGANIGATSGLSPIRLEGTDWWLGGRSGVLGLIVTRLLRSSLGLVPR